MEKRAIIAELHSQARKKFKHYTNLSIIQMSIMNEKILKELVKTRKNLKMKFQSIKLDKNKSYIQLENAFKPITEPLEKLIEVTSKKQSKRRIHNPRENKFKLTNISELYNKE